MKFGAYVVDKAMALCFWGIACGLFGLLATFAGIEAQAIGLILAPQPLLALAYLVVTYAWERRKTAVLEKMMLQLPEKYLLGEVLPAPKGFTEYRYYRVLQAISHNAIDTVMQAEQEKESYYEDVEKWIHELKTPLATCSLILENGGNSAKLKQELKRMDNLTESILYRAHLRPGAKDLRIQKFSVREAIDNAIKSQASLLIAARVCVEIEGNFAAYSEPGAVCFMIKQLLSNAAKHCPGCCVKITASNGAINVEDNGPGIPTHDLRRVTERGFTHAEGGTGMGLYIVRGLCARLEMDMQITSVQGKYTRVTLSFPNLTKL